MRKSIPSTKEITAILAGCKPDELINFRILEDGTAVAITPTGQKYTYTLEDLDAIARSYNTVERMGTEERRPEKPSVSNLDTETPGGQHFSVPNLDTEGRQLLNRYVTKKEQGNKSTRKPSQPKERGNPSTGKSGARTKK